MPSAIRQNSLFSAHLWVLQYGGTIALSSEKLNRSY
jgi:hypothetical protein